MGFAVVVNARVSAKEKGADVSEDGGATGGDAIFGDEFKETGEGVINALRGLESLRAFEEEFGMVCLGGERLGELGVVRAERRFRGGGQAALLVVGKAVLAARGAIGDVVDGAWVRAHDGPRNWKFGNLDIGIPDGYQKKGVVGEAKRMVVKRRELARIGFERAEKQRNVLGKQNAAGLRCSHGRVA